MDVTYLTFAMLVIYSICSIVSIYFWHAAQVLNKKVYDLHRDNSEARSGQLVLEAFKQKLSEDFFDDDREKFKEHLTTILDMEKMSKTLELRQIELELKRLEQA
jgi:hypothetical protein